MKIVTGNLVVVDGAQYLVSKIDAGGGVHGRRCTDEELSAGVDLGGRDVLHLGTAEQIEARGGQVFDVE